MADISPGTAFLAAMQTALNPTALFIINKRLLAQNDTWPRFVVERLEIIEAPQRTQGNPRSFSADDHQFAFHCWGNTEDDCEHMRQALVTAARGYLKGRNYVITSSAWTEPTWAQTGFVLTVMMTCTFPLVKAIVPTVAPTPPALYPAPAVSVTNDTDPTVVVETDLVTATFTPPPT